MSWTVLFIGIGLVALQGILSYLDRTFTQSQMQVRGLSHGYSFMQQGSMLADVFVISPIAAYIMGKYRLEYDRWYSILILSLAIGTAVAMGILYNKIGLTIPVPQNHDGRTTLAGWIHGIFAIGTIWILVMFYFTPLIPQASTKDILAISVLLTPFFFLGVYNFSEQWVFIHEAKIQVFLEITILWTITGIKLLWFR